MDNFLSLIIGGLLAGITGIFVEFYKEWRKNHRSRELLRTILKDDLQNSKLLYDRIDREWHNSKTVFFASLLELKESRSGYERNKDWTVLFQPEELRREITLYYHRSSAQIAILQSQQARIYDLHRLLRDAQNSIFREMPGIPTQVATDKIGIQLAEEVSELQRLTNGLTDEVYRLVQFNQQAELLLSKLAL